MVSDSQRQGFILKRNTMGKLVLFMHTSLDNFVAGLSGGMDWINVDEEIFDFAGQRTNQAGTALYGRVTYQMMESYWPTAADQPGATKHDIQHSKWYKSVPKVVLSRSLKEENLKNTRIIREGLATNINKLKQETDKEIIIFGSPSAVHSLMAENLIDDYWLFVNPVLLGHGIPFFKRIKAIPKLKLVMHHAFSSGVMCLHFESQLHD